MNLRLNINTSINTLLIDTGADISILKESCIPEGLIINNSVRHKIKGVTEGLTFTLGIVEADILIQNYRLNHVFHIVSDDFPIPGHGILGRNFFIEYNANINYADWILQIQKSGRCFSIPIQSGVSENKIHIPARSEVFRELKSLKNTKNYVLIVDHEIQKGVFISRRIANATDPIVRILNTTNLTVTLDENDIVIHALADYNIFLFRNNVRGERNKQLLQCFSKQAPKHIEKELIDLCLKYSNIFALKEDEVTPNNFYNQSLRLKDNTPVYTRNYRIPNSQKTEINEQVNKLLRQKIIEPSMSEYNSPILLVPKKSADNKKTWRLVVDYRKVNKKLIADKFPLPRIETILENLGKAKWFSVLDLISGFHQIPLNEDSRDITSFSTDSGSFRFTRLPFGLSVSPNSFQRMMSIAFSGLSPDKAFMYIDDLIVIGRSEKHHLQNLEKVFETCNKYNLKLNPSKCKFFQNEVTYLGHKITDKGILPDDSKFDVINNYPEPKNADEVKRFVAFCNYYRRFIKNFAEITYPLNQLTKKRAIFNWTDECRISFQNLKKALISPQILQYPDFSKPFVLTCDASGIACGAVLAQQINGVDMPVAYASKTFTKGESHKPTILKELTAIHWAIKHFHCYLYGQEKFLVKTDHRPLIYLFSMKDPTSKLTRMRLDLEEYNFDIIYIKGKDNVCADALSRISINELKNLNSVNAQINVVTRSMSRKNNDNNRNTHENVEVKDLRQPKVYTSLEKHLRLPLLKFRLRNSNKLLTVEINVFRKKKSRVHTNISFTRVNKLALEQLFSKLDKLAGDNGLSDVRLYMTDEIFSQFKIGEFKSTGINKLNNLNIILCERPKIIKEKVERDNLIKKFHEDPAYGGHCGQKRLLKKLKTFYRWKGMSKDVAKFTKSCHKCQVNKINRKHLEKMSLTPTPQKAFDIVCIDTIGPLNKTSLRNSYAVTIQCELTKYVIICPIPNKEAATVSKAIVENLFLVYGPMKEIRTDMGTEYRNEVFSNIAKLLNIEHKVSTAYHSQTIGGCERNHRVLNEFLRNYANENLSDWDILCKYFAFCYNTTPSSYHEFTPFELVFAHKANLTAEIFGKTYIDPIYNIDAYDQEIRFRLQTVLNKVKKHLDQVKLERKKVYDNKSFPLSIQPGDLVLLAKENRQKLDPWFEGPFKVISIDEPNCVIENSDEKRTKVHKNRLKKYTSS